jgi:4-hydroxy-tetrahydrodipicolinate reductase
MIKVFVDGFAGRMGSLVARTVAEASDMELVGGYDPHAGVSSFALPDGSSVPAAESLEAGLRELKPDVVVDFTHPSAVADNIRTVLACGVACVVGTTGLSAEQVQALFNAAPAGSHLFVAPNFTTGAVLMQAFSKIAARYFPDAEVIEFHHNGKADAPSGTARDTARAIAAERSAADLVSTAPGKETEIDGCEGVRGGLVDGVPVHSVRSDGFVAHQEVIFGSAGQTLTIRHDSIDRTSYMPGVLLAIRKVQATDGLTIGLDKLMGL